MDTTIDMQITHIKEILCTCVYRNTNKVIKICATSTMMINLVVWHVPPFQMSRSTPVQCMQIILCILYNNTFLYTYENSSKVMNSNSMKNNVHFMNVRMYVSIRIGKTNKKDNVIAAILNT